MTERTWIILIACITAVILVSISSDYLRKRRVDKDRSPRALAEAAKAGSVSLEELCNALTILDRGFSADEASEMISKNKEGQNDGRKSWH